MRHPRQPIVEDSNGIPRFKRNAIVEHLLNKGGFDMNQLATWDFTDEDRCQFAQLIGYSEEGYNTLSYAQREEDSDPLNIDDLPIGFYIAYVGGYQDSGTVSLDVQAADECAVNLGDHFPFLDGEYVSVESTVMPHFWRNTKKIQVSGGEVIEIEILKDGGYVTLGKLR